jgi:multicomponent Na+:H+ antiporter subunit D
VSPELEKMGFYTLVHFLIFGVSGAFLTGDYFNMYVWYEVMILSSFGLMAIGRSKNQMQGLLKYGLLNFLASTFFLIGLGLLYGVVGSLNIGDVTQKLSNLDGSNQALGAALFMSVGFAIKAAVFPFYSWLPTSYHLTTFTASALFSGLLTKVGLYSMIRLLGMSFAFQKEIIAPIFITISILTMLMGVFGAASQFSARRILSFHIISQIGYMTLALGFFSEAAFAAAIFYLIHHIIVKSNLFLISGLIQDTQGSEDLKKTGSGLKNTPWLAIVFIISGYSLGGIPPLSGFFAKYAILKEGMLSEAYWSVGTGLFVGLLTLYSMTKIWAEAFWKNHPHPQVQVPQMTTSLLFKYATVTGLAACTLLISLSPDVLMRWSQAGARTIMNPQEYVTRVMGIKEVNR